MLAKFVVSIVIFPVLLTITPLVNSKALYPCSIETECIGGENFPSMTPEDFHTKDLQDEFFDSRLSALDESAIAALSKLLNLRLSNIAHLQHQRRRGGFNFYPKMASPKLPVIEKARDLSEKEIAPVRSDELAKSEFKSRKFHCHPIEDVFIPAVDKMVPAYICKLDSRQFILSSERFLQDYRYHLDVAVDEDTFQRLAINDETKDVETSVADVIPVTLTQRKGEETYGVRKT